MTARNAFGNLQLDATGQAIDADVKAVKTSVDAVDADIKANTTAVSAALTQGDGGATWITGTKTKFRDGFTTGTVGQPVDPAVWKLVNESPDSGDGTGHLVMPGGDSQGAAYLRVSLSPFVAGSSVHLASIAKFPIPIRHAWGVSSSTRITGQEIIFGLGEALDSDATLGLNRLAQPADLPIVGTVTTSGTVQTMTVTNHGLKGTDRVVVLGNAEKRLNVGPLYVTVVDANTITVPNTLAASTYAAGGVVRLAEPTGLLNNAALQLWGDNTTATQATYTSRRNGTKPRVATGAGAVTNFPTQANASPYSDAWLAPGPFEIWANIDEVVWRSWADGNGGIAGYTKFQQSIPDETLSYRLYARAKNLDNMSRPIARITSISKAGGTTATVTTDVTHNLAVGDQVGIWGVRNQTDFPNTGTWNVASIVSATQFTISVGATIPTITDSFGGAVWLNHGAFPVPTVLNQVVQNITKVGSILSIGGNGSWANVLPGDYVNLHGTITSGTGNNFDGAYKVLRLNGVTLELAYTGALPDQLTYNTGGQVIRRTDVRLHFARVLSHSRVMTEVIGGRGNTADNNNSVPVAITGGVTLNINPPSLLTTVSEFASLTVTNLIANAVFTQTAVDTGVNATSRYGSIRALVGHVAGQTPGALTLEQSTDNVTFRETHRIPIPSDFVTALHSFDFPLQQRYWRFKFTNGATAQTAFYLAAQTLRGEPLRDTAKTLIFPMTAVAGQALALSGTFTSAVLDLGQNHSWSVARLLASSDQASAASGVAVQQSMDGAAGWFNSTAGANTAGGAALVEEKIACRYLRVVYVNGATAATTLRLSMSLVSL